MARLLGRFSVADGVLGLYPSFETTHQILAREIRTLWDAFGECCREELGLEPDVVLGAWTRPVLEELNAALANTRASPPGQEEVSDIAKIMTELWRKEIGNEDC